MARHLLKITAEKKMTIEFKEMELLITDQCALLMEQVPLWFQK